MRTLFLFVTVVIVGFAGFSQGYVPEWNNPKIVIKPAAAIQAFAFPLRDVRLLESPFKSAMQTSIGYLMSLDPDRFLSDFRTHAGLKPKAEKYGGWESAGVAGHSLGHYLSALSIYYAATGDAAVGKRISYIVDELQECQAARKTGYVGAIPNEDTMWAQVARGDIRSHGFDLNGGWSPWYTVHKVMAGLADAYLFAGNKTALQVDQRLADWVGNTLRNLPDSSLQKMLVCEYGGMPDVLTNLYEVTGEKSYLDLSYKFYDNRILDSLALPKDILPGKHSNTQIPKIIGAARRYQVAQDARDLAIAKFFWNTVTQHHSYATGGNSNYEYLGPPDQLADQLTDNTTETCNTYNMLKLTRQLFMLQPSASYMDYYEKALYNHILASQNHRTAMTTYFVSLRMGGRKEYSDSLNTFTCCVGTGMENHVKYNETIYMRGRDGSLYVNLFIPSMLNWKEKGVTIKQETTLPASAEISYSISAAKPIAFTIRIRKPRWTQHEQVRVNGVLKKLTLDASGYITLTKTWKTGDKIDLQLPEQVYTEAMPDKASRQALFYGPVLLAGVLGTKEPEPSDVPVFVTSNSNANAWLERTNTANAIFKTTGVGLPQDVALIPFNQIADEWYSVYWDVFTPGQWAVQQKLYEAEKQKARELELRTTDILRIGEMQPERDHDFVGEKLVAGDEHNRQWRMAEDSGYFSFSMQVDSVAGHTLICTYWGTDNRGRTFDIFADDSLLATEDLNKYKGSKFYDVPYTVPQTATKGKTSVMIRFIPKARNSAGPVYGVRMLKGGL